MPFWSMVVFMVKWAIASIPAIILLVFIVTFSSPIITSLISSVQSAKNHQSDKPYTSSTAAPSVIQQGSTRYESVFGSDVPDRCKGSTELEKCIAMAKQLKNETTEQKEIRRKLVEPER
jgi:hypothetical protein